MPYKSGKLKGELTSAELRRLVRSHNKLMSITIPTKTDRDGIIALIKKNGYEVDHKGQKLVPKVKMKRKPVVPLPPPPPKKTAKEKADAKKTRAKKKEMAEESAFESRKRKIEAVKKIRRKPPAKPPASPKKKAKKKPKPLAIEDLDEEKREDVEQIRAGDRRIVEELETAASNIIEYHKNGKKLKGTVYKSRKQYQKDVDRLTRTKLTGIMRQLATQKERDRIDEAKRLIKNGAKAPAGPQPAGKMGQIVRVAEKMTKFYAPFDKGGHQGWVIGQKSVVKDPKTKQKKVVAEGGIYKGRADYLKDLAVLKSWTGGGTAEQKKMIEDVMKKAEADRKSPSDVGVNGFIVDRSRGRRNREFKDKYKKTIYQVLGVNNRIYPEDFKVVATELRRKNHPDKGGKADKFAMINEAIQIMNETYKGYVNP